MIVVWRSLLLMISVLFIVSRIFTFFLRTVLHKKGLNQSHGVDADIETCPASLDTHKHHHAGSLGSHIATAGGSLRLLVLWGKPCLNCVEVDGEGHVGRALRSELEVGMKTYRTWKVFGWAPNLEDEVRFSQLKKWVKRRCAVERC